jgi:hypothetical protein
MRKTIVLLCLTGLLGGALIGAPAEAAKRKPKKCAKYTGGTQAEAPLAKVTDKATVKKPLAIELDGAPGIGVGGEEATETFIGHTYQNIQVDSKYATRKLFVRLEMPFGRDYDLYVLDAAGAEKARAAGFNPAPAVYNDTDGGGHTEEEAEMIDGLLTARCTGYTVDIASASAEGNPVILKLWLVK